MMSSVILECNNHANIIGKEYSLSRKNEESLIIFWEVEKPVEDQDLVFEFMKGLC